MRIAIFHDYLNQFGGAERVLKVLLSLFPKAHLYTLLYDKNKTFEIFDDNIKKTSFLDKPFVRNNHRMFIPLMPFASQKMRVKNDYDLVISSTAGYAKGFGFNRGHSHRYRHSSDSDRPFHISYCHSPLRYAWEIDYLKNQSFAPNALSRSIAIPIARWLRNWDKSAAQNVNLFVANSDFIARKIKNYYGRESLIVYPPVDSKKFYYESKVQNLPPTTYHLQPTTYNLQPKTYYLMVGRLLYYKNFDLGIKAFNKLRKPLKIIGSGPEMFKLKSIANPVYIEFIPFVDDAELKSFYNNAKALIFPQVEDFGLVAAEAQSCGLPVIAFNQGGTCEIVKNKETGLFFNEQKPEAIIEAVKIFENMNFNREKIAEIAVRFSEERFKNEFMSIVRNSGYDV